MAITHLPATHKALVQEVKSGPFTVKELPTPQATPGSAIVKIETSPIVSYMREAFDGTRPMYQYPTPFTPGTSAIGRIAALGPDAVKLKVGDLVLIDCLIHARDDEEALMLLGLAEGGTEGSKKLMAGEWRYGTFAEYAKAPLENCFVLNEAKLCGELGHTVDQLCWILQGLVPYGGLRSIGLQAGERVIVAPATGGFGSAAVVVALAMGASVIAMGRNKEQLERIKALNPSRVDVVPITGNVEEEVAALKKHGRINAFFDISPATAQKTTHVKSAILSLTHSGRVSFMGGFVEDLPIPHRFIMRWDITLKGKWMYTRNDILAFIQFLESGGLSVKDMVSIVGTFGLNDWKKGFDVAMDEGGRLGHIAVFHP